MPQHGLCEWGPCLPPQEPAITCLSHVVERAFLWPAAYTLGGSASAYHVPWKPRLDMDFGEGLFLAPAFYLQESSHKRGMGHSQNVSKAVPAFPDVC